MKKEFVRNGVKFTMEIVDWAEFKKVIDKVDEFCNEELGDWSTHWYVRDQFFRCGGVVTCARSMKIDC